MALVIWTTFAAVLWIVLWALGAKPFDAALLGILIVLVGATGEILKRYLPSRRGS